MRRPAGLSVLPALLLCGAAWAAPTAIAPEQAPISAELPARPTPADGVLADRVVATVNDDVILLSEVYAFDTYIEEQAQSGTRAEAEQQATRILRADIEARTVGQGRLF